MHVRTTVDLRGMPDNTDPEAIRSLIHSKLHAEFWPRPFHHIETNVESWDYSPSMRIQRGPGPLTEKIAAAQAKALEDTSRPVYVISDLHMGDGGPRDNFGYGDREKQLLAFLDFVEQHNGRLIICGDLFELWQSNISRVLTYRTWLLDRLAAMGAIYILGNHDADLTYFTPGWLSHPFFATKCLSHEETIGGRHFLFCHGHVADPYCASDVPGLGRITAIYTGMREDRHGSPVLDKYRTVEEKALGPLEKLASLWGRLRGQPDRRRSINQQLRNLLEPGGHSVVVSGHTHYPGLIGGWHLNCGTWAERVNSFVCISPEGGAGVFDWIDGKAVPNQTELPV